MSGFKNCCDLSASVLGSIVHCFPSERGNRVTVFRVFALKEYCLLLIFFAKQHIVLTINLNLSRLLSFHGVCSLADDSIGTFEEMSTDWYLMPVSVSRTRHCNHVKHLDREREHDYVCSYCMGLSVPMKVWALDWPVQRTTCKTHWEDQSLEDPQGTRPLVTLITLLDHISHFKVL